MEKMFLGHSFEFGGKLGSLQDNGDCEGVYIFVLPNDFGKVELLSNGELEESCAEIEPAFSQEKLQAKLTDSNILYIGRSNNMRARVELHKQYWKGEDVRARGGRAIGQIKGWNNLEVWYFPCTNPIQTKSALLKSFLLSHSTLPFANWQQ